MNERGILKMVLESDIEKRIDYLNKMFEISNKRNILEVDFNLSEINEIYRELDPETIFIEKEEYIFLRYIIENKLRPKERDVLKLRFGFTGKNYNYKEISSILKINKRAVLQIEKSAIKNLKFFLIHDDLFYKKKSSK